MTWWRAYKSYPAYIRSLQDRFDGVPVICDVEGELYKALGPGSAADREEVLGSAIIAAETVAKEADLVHGEDLGNPLQYPGLFVIAPDGEIHYAFRTDAPVGRSALAGRRSQRSRPALTVLHTTKKERNQMVSLLFSQFTGSGHSSR